MNTPQTPDWKSFFPPPYKHYMGAIWVQNDGEHKMLDVRGWGHLTGRGQKRFISDDATAEKVQDEMGNWAANALNACAGMDDPTKEIAAMREAIKEAHEALDGCREDTCELIAERDWWKDEPRCGYAVQYQKMLSRLAAAEFALAKLQPFLKP